MKCRHLLNIIRTYEHYIYLPDAGKGSAVCSSLHCGTRYLIAVLARPTAQVPRWAGNVSGGPGSFPGRFWRTGVPYFRRCSAKPLHSGSVSIVMSFGPCTDHCTTGSVAGGAWKTKKNEHYKFKVQQRRSQQTWTRAWDAWWRRQSVTQTTLIKYNPC